MSASRRADGLLGAVLAGGRSVRYGADKSAARVGGVPMVQRVLRAAEAVADELVVVSPRPVAGAETVRRIPDRVPGLGPLGGLHAALHEARDLGLARVLLLGCDLPLVTPGLLEDLVAAGEGAPAAAPAWSDGRVHALCSLWSVFLLDEVESRVRDGEERALQALFRTVGGRAVDPRTLAGPDAGALLNVNTPADRARAEARLHSGPEDA